MKRILMFVPVFLLALQFVGCLGQVQEKETTKVVPMSVSPPIETSTETPNLPEPTPPVLTPEPEPITPEPLVPPTPIQRPEPVILEPPVSSAPPVPPVPPEPPVPPTPPAPPALTPEVAVLPESIVSEDKVVTEIKPAQNAQDNDAKKLEEVIKRLGGSCKTSPKGELTLIKVDGAALTADVFELFGKQPELTTLQVANFRGLNDTVFSKILGLKKLTTLAITNAIITDASVEALVKAFPTLRSLDLSRNALLTDKSMVHIGNLKELESLVVNYCAFSEFGLMNIESLPKLRALDIRGNVKISSSGLGIVAKMPSLRSLKHMSNMIDDNALAELSAAKNLDTLDMYDFMITDAAGEELNKLPKLSSLVIFRCLNFGSQGLLALKNKPLKRLTLRDLASLDDVGMEAFRDFTALRRLYLHELNSITDVGMMNLVYLKELEELDIWSVPLITDKAIESIAKLPNLKTLSIRSTKITDKSVDLLLTIPKLEALTLRDNAEITDSAKAKLKESNKFKKLTIDSQQKTQ
ncbi:MAG: hypothetical protein LBH59_09645 [Planctomycetaceae bacterium]|jgi:Leucine-rich repeat (LRR) protein|nr:hypothetical protein [Planctomycetaceae bacterium]